jgi:hypothetical protein
MEPPECQECGRIMPKQELEDSHLCDRDLCGRCITLTDTDLASQRYKS